MSDQLLHLKHRDQELQKEVRIYGLHLASSTGQFAKLRSAPRQIFHIYFLRPWKPTKCAVSVLGNLSQLTDTVCLPNKQALLQITSLFSVFLTLELKRQSCI